MHQIKQAKKLVDKLPSIFGHDIWQATVIGERTPKGRIFSFLRIISIVYRGLNKNSIFSQSASLSYYSLIGLGPVLAIAIMISSFFIGGKNDDEVIRDALVKVVYFIAPPTAEFSKIDGTANLTHDTATSSAAAITTDTTITDLTDRIAPGLIDIISQIIESAQSGTVGIVGLIMLIIIAIQVITVIEATFNTVWGVQRGRSWLHRIVFYWTFISLGAVLGAGSLFLVSYTTIAQFFNQFTINLAIVDVSRFAGNAISFFMAVVVLSCFYKFIPNTAVRWVSAISGAFFVSGLLFINHFLSFLYAQRALATENFYGSVGIVFVFMLGLYIFWLIVLLGGQITYSVQNVNNLANQKIWENMSIQSREMLCLATVLLTSRRFINRETAPTSGELSSALQVPSQTLNGCLNQLNEMNWITPVDASNSDDDDTIRYQPSRPLHDATLEDFDRDFVNLGNNAGSNVLTHTDPVLIKLHDAPTHDLAILKSIPLSELLKPN